MICLRDTNTCVHYLRKGSASPLSAKLSSFKPGDVVVCSVVVADRGAAVRALRQADRQVEPALRRTLTEKPSLEVRRRVEDLLRELSKKPSAQTLRSLRAIAALEHIGSPDARRVLQELSRGAPAARETQAAEDALKRCR